MTNLTPAHVEYLASQRLGRLATAGADNDVEARLQGPAASVRVVGGRGVLTGWAALCVDDLVSVDPWRARFLEIRGRAEAIPSGGAHLGPGFGEAFIRLYPDKVNSFGSSRRPAHTVSGVRRYFYDTEFIEDGTTIDLVSIGIVDETGREFYAVSTQFDDRKAIPWVRRNVLDKLPSPSDPAWRSRDRIREDLLAYLTEPGEEIELWAWLAAYDHVVLAQLWGPMPGLPREIPRFTKELRQRWDDLGRPPLPPKPAGSHDALVDARYNLARWHVMEGTRR